MDADPMRIKQTNLLRVKVSRASLPWPNAYVGEIELENFDFEAECEDCSMRPAIGRLFLIHEACVHLGEGETDSVRLWPMYSYPDADIQSSGLQ